MNSFTNYIEHQTGILSSQYMNPDCTEVDLNTLLFRTLKSSYSFKNGPDSCDLNYNFLNYFFSTGSITKVEASNSYSFNSFSLNNYNYTSLYKSLVSFDQMFEHLINNNLSSYLKGVCEKHVESIPNEYKKLSSKIYQKRIYNGLSLFLGIANISLLEMYYNYREVFQNYIKNYNETQNVHKLKPYAEEIVKTLNLYNTVNKNNISLKDSTPLNESVKNAINTIIKMLDVPTYLNDEFCSNEYGSSNIFSIILSLLCDHLVVNDDKKTLYKLFTELHIISNRKNKSFFKIVYNKNIAKDKHILVYSNHPKLMYYYIMFYKTYQKGKFFKKILKRNALFVLLTDLKMTNNTILNLSKILPKIEVLFNKYKTKDDPTLNTFLSIDYIITSRNTENVFDMLEQNMDFLDLLIKTGLDKPRLYSYQGYYRKNMISYGFMKETVVCIAENHHLTDENNRKRFWNLVENLLLSYRNDYKTKKRILKFLKSIDNDGYNEFAITAAPELQPIICELLLS